MLTLIAISFAHDRFARAVSTLSECHDIEKMHFVIAQTMMTKGGPKDVEGLKGIFVGVCGPVGLGDECAKAVGMIDSAKRDEVGGVELHEEYVFSTLAVTSSTKRAHRVFGW